MAKTIKCRVCQKQLSTNGRGYGYCSDCKEATVGDKEQLGIKSNNPDGHNKHTPKNALVEKKKKYIHMNYDARRKLAMELYQAMLKFRRLANSAQTRFNHLTGIDQLPFNKEVEEMSDERLITIADEI